MENHLDGARWRQPQVCKAAFIGLGVWVIRWRASGKKRFEVTVYNRTDTKAKKWVEDMGEGAPQRLPLPMPKSCSPVSGTMTMYGLSARDRMGHSQR